MTPRGFQTRKKRYNQVVQITNIDLNLYPIGAFHTETDASNQIIALTSNSNFPKRKNGARKSAPTGTLAKKKD